MCFNKRGKNTMILKISIVMRLVNFLPVECVQNPATYFAKRIYKALDGSGTDDRSLIRILVSRSEIDLGSIKTEYEKLYDKTMESDITVRYYFICIYSHIVTNCKFQIKS